MYPSPEEFVVIKDFNNQIKYRDKLIINIDYTKGEKVTGYPNKGWLKDRLKSGHLVRV